MTYTVMEYIYDSKIEENILPRFQWGFNYNTMDSDLDDGLILRTISANELPTSIMFSNKSALIEIISCNATNCSSLAQSFYNNGNLKKAKILFGSKVMSLSHIFYYASKLEYLDMSGCDFSNCTDTSNVLTQNVITELVLKNTIWNNSTVDIVRGCSSSLKILDLKNVNTKNVTDMSNLFRGKTSLSEIDLSYFDTSNVTDMSYMFNGTNLTEINMSTFDISKVTTFRALCSNCAKLKSIIISNTSLPVSNVNVSIYGMFEGCSSIEVLDLSTMVLLKIHNMVNAFYNMKNLRVLNISTFKTTPTVQLNHAFFGSPNIEILDISNIDLKDTNDLVNSFNPMTSLKHIGMMYCNSDTINKTMESIATNNIKSIYISKIISGINENKKYKIICDIFKSINIKINDVYLRSNGNVYDSLNLTEGLLIKYIGEDNEVLDQPVITKIDLQGQKVYSYDGTTHYTCQSESGYPSPILSIEVPTDLISLVNNHKVEIKSLNEEVNTLSLENEKLKQMDNELVATSWDMDFRMCAIEWSLEDLGIGQEVMMLENNMKGSASNMALSRYEQAKIMIVGGVYKKITLTKQLTTYLNRGYLTQEEYDELIALMEAKDLVVEE